MAFDINAYLGNSVAALKLGSDRTELIARNLANADTPNYKARDIDFRSALAAASPGANTSSGAPLALTATQASHLTTTGAAGSAGAAGATGAAGAAGAAGAGDPLQRPDLKYRVPLAPSLDGNTVDPQLEQAAFAQNAVRYQATLTFLNAKFHSLMTAITGQ